MATEYKKEIYENTIHSKKELEIISLLDKNINWVARLNKAGIFLLFTLLVINISTFSSWESNLVLLVPIISMLIGIGGYYIFKKIKFWPKDKFYYRENCKMKCIRKLTKKIM